MGLVGCTQKVIAQVESAHTEIVDQEETMECTGSNSLKGRRSRSEHPLNEGLDKRLASYAAVASAAGVGQRARSPQAAQVIARAAGAAGVGLLLTGGPASARIVYTPAYTSIPSSHCSGCLLLDLNHDGIADFRFAASAGSLSFFLVVSSLQPGNAILGTLKGVLGRAGTPGSCSAASALPAGHRIGPGSKFGRYGQMASSFQGFSRSSGSCFSGVEVGRQCGYWRNAQGRFLGFEFTIEGQTHFGWARLNVIGLTLTGYAYETEPNKPIRAGDTGPVADARVPEVHSAPPSVATLPPATLGVLALGSAGLDMWRKEQ
jgi:hypothetical protein